MPTSSSSDKSPPLPSSSSLAIPVVAGLIVGVALMVIFSVWHSQDQTANLQQQKPGHGISTVVIPPAASLMASNKTFEPNTIQVVIGVNNTVRWTNQDTSRVTITSYPNVTDSSFYLATIPPLSKTLSKGESFDFTFDKPGEYAYHAYGNDSRSGSIIVLPKEYKDFVPYKPKISEEKAVQNVLDFLKPKVKSIDRMEIYGLTADGKWRDKNTRLLAKDLYHSPEEFKDGKIALNLRYCDYAEKHYVHVIRINDSFDAEPEHFDIHFLHVKGRLVYLLDTEIYYTIESSKRAEDGGGNSTNVVTKQFYTSSAFLVDALTGEVIRSWFEPYS